MVKKTYLKMNFTFFLWCVFIFSLSVFSKGCVHCGIQGAHMDGVNANGEENLIENEFYKIFLWCVFIFFSLYLQKGVYMAAFTVLTWMV